MSQKDSSTFSNKIDEIFSEIQTTYNQQERKILAQKLIVEVWKELNKNWTKKYAVEEYSLEITETIKNCTKGFDASKGKKFSHYLLTALSRELKNAERKEASCTSKNIPIHCDLKDENNNTYATLITDFLALSADTKQNLTDEEKIDLLEEIKSDLKHLSYGLSKEHENIDIKSALLTQQILYHLNKRNFCGIETDRFFALYKDFDFLLNKTLWVNFFKNNELPTQEEVAIALKCKKSNASKMMSRFYKRLKNQQLEQSNNV